MQFEFVDILFYVASTSYVLPMIFIFFRRRSTYSPLFYYIVLNVISTIVSLYFNIRFGNAYPVFHFSIFLTSLLLIRFYQNNDPKYQKVYLLFMLILFLIFSSEMLFLDGIWQNNFYSTIYVNVLMTFLSFRGLFILFNSNENNEIKILESKFYIYIAILIFNSSSFFFSILENQIRSAETYLFYITIPLFLILIIVHNILLSIGLWKQAKV